MRTLATQPGEPIVMPRVPVLTIEAEADAILGNGAAAGCEDGSMTRLWEVTGTGHAKTYAMRARRRDDGRLSADELAALIYEPFYGPQNMSTTEPINCAPQLHYVMQAGLAHLERWVIGGEPPSHAPLIETQGEGTERTLELDEHGIGQCGIRSPWVDAPHDDHRDRRRTRPAGHVRHHQTFFPEMLAALYPTASMTISLSFSAAAERARAAGFLLDADMVEITEPRPGCMARLNSVGRLRHPAFEVALVPPSVVRYRS
jgi:Alpha/beta hydrolase domain